MKKRKISNICCIGAGYVGGPTMAVLADNNPKLKVTVVDINKQKIDLWNSKDLKYLPIYEPGLAKVISRNRDVNLFFSYNVSESIAEADMVFISVNTPTKKKGFGAGFASDLKWVESSARQVAKYSRGHTIVVEKSTLPVKTAQTIKTILQACEVKCEDINKNKSFSILSNPEFLAEGTAINDLQNPDRVLIGGDDNNAIKLLKEIYLNWVEDYKILTTDLWSSELSKLISNAFLAQRISSINSISALCEATQSNINNVAKAVGMDKRIGPFFLEAGPGFGGSCFKKDISNLIYICNHYGLSEVASYWEKVILINQWQQKRISKIIVEKLFGNLSEKKIAILGFAFKSNTNDTRESPAISICKDLLEEGCFLSIYDPKVKKEQIDRELKLINTLESDFDNEKHYWEKSKNINEACDNSDAIVILTNWEEFLNLDFKKMQSIMKSPSWIFDTRNMVELSQAERYGFNIWKLGDGF